MEVNHIAFKINRFGYEWIVRNTAPNKEGPGPNIFSSVYVTNPYVITDDIVLSCDNLFSSEIYLDKPLGYGLYEFEVECPVFLPKGLVAGVFLYKDDKNEVDIELSRWDKTFSRNAQLMSQKSGNKVRLFNFQKNNKIYIEFRKDKIVLNLNSNGIEFIGPNSSIDKNATVHINLWTYGTPGTAQIKLKNFKFTKWN